MEHIKGHLILLMAPSGSGKQKIVEALGSVADSIYFAKTFTSRAEREGTEENPKYNFISTEEFQQKIEEGVFVEWANFSGNLYGTPKSEILESLTAGKVVFKEMELQGIMQIKELVPAENITVIYIEAGGWEELEKRILARASIDEKELSLRKLRYLEESKTKHIADMVVNNFDGKLEEAQQEFKSIVEDILTKVAD